MKKSSWMTSGLSTKVLISVILGLSVILGIVVEVIIHNSEEYKVARFHIESNKEVLELVGKVEGYGLLVSRSTDKLEKNSRLGISVKGEKRGCRVKVYFKRDESEEWIFDSLEIVK